MCFKFSDFFEGFLIIRIGENDDRDAAQLHISRNFIEHLETVLFRHLEIQNDSVWPVLTDHCKTLLTITSQNCIEVLTIQIEKIDLPKIRIIIYDTYLGPYKWMFAHSTNSIPYPGQYF